MKERKRERRERERKREREREEKKKPKVAGKKRNPKRDLEVSCVLPMEAIPKLPSVKGKERRPHW
jgi:hypothetical protein